MNIKVAVGILLLVGLQGCDGTSMEDDTAEVITPNDPLIVNCDTYIAEEIKEFGDAYTLDRSFNDGVSHENYHWEFGENSYTTHFIWGGPYVGCEINRFVELNDSDYVPNGVCQEDIKGILDNYGGIAERISIFLHDSGEKYSYWWFDDGFYYQFEIDYGNAECNIGWGEF